jgi:hypothetical protein
MGNNHQQTSDNDMFLLLYFTSRYPTVPTPHSHSIVPGGLLVTS